MWVETTRLVGDRSRARWLCEVASGSVDGDEFLARLDEAATIRMVAHLDAMIARLRTGEPLQYVLGEWSFRRITLAVDRRVLIPRPETELVAEVALAKAAEVGPTRVVADLGTGSGAIGLSLAHELPLDGTTVWITDAERDALDVARANIAGLGRAGVNVRVAHGSWFDALPAGLALRRDRVEPAVRGRGLARARTDRRRLGTARRAVRRPRRARRHPADRRRCAARGSAPEVGWCWRSAPTRARPSRGSSLRQGSRTWWSDATSPALDRIALGRCP